MRFIVASIILFSLCLAKLSSHSQIRNEDELKSKLSHASSDSDVARSTIEQDPEKPSLLANSTVSSIAKAREVVKLAIEQSAVRNKARVLKPLRNQYMKDPRTGLNKRDNEDVVPLLNITDEIRVAAALVAEADAFDEYRNVTQASRKEKRAGNFWLGSIAHSGSWPWGNNDKNYKVFRDVTAPPYNAKGDGKTDDTAAINKAVRDFDMCGPGCYSSTTKGAIIYFPPGTYLVSSTIETYYGTQFVGDAIDRPTIKASKSFVGLGVISTDRYVDNGGNGADGKPKQWFINTANFYRQIRNFIIDIVDTPENAYVAALHYQVAQATSLQFIEFRASTSATTTQQAIFAENGSGGFMSDLVFNGGAFGIYGGNQQFTSQRLFFNNVHTAIQLIWDWGWTWKSIKVRNCGTGYRLLSEDGVHNTGSVMIVDSIFENTPIAIQTFPATQEPGDGTTGVTLDNVKFVNVDKAITDGTTTYLQGSVGSVDTWVLGRVYIQQKKYNALSNEFHTPRNPGLLGSNPDGLPKNPYFERPKPQYEVAGTSQFVHMKQYCKGDGTSDDTRCFQSTLDAFGQSSIIFIDAGSYILKDTINIPNNAKIVGENWAQLVATGDKFNNAKNPIPLVRVGQKSSRGTVEMQDLLFTSKGPTPGLIFVEWNIRSDGPGKAGIWDCHVRVGGAIGTDLTTKECPPGRDKANSAKCNAGSAMMHITPGGSGYFENMWLWVADHDIDDTNWADDNNTMEQTSVYVARGLLIESTAPTWLYGTASEHSVFYQYQFLKAKNVIAGMIQTESPYYQPTPKPPEPLKDALGAMPGDPPYNCKDGESCDASWALRIIESSNITIHGAGLYSWFKTYTQECLATQDCQNVLVELKDNYGSVNIHNLVTIGTKNMINTDGTLIKSKDNLAVKFHPYWSQIAVFDAQSFKKPCSSDPIVEPSKPPDGSWNAIRTEVDGQMAYLSIVNGSPYEFKLDGSHNHQMLHWDQQWVSIPAGESAQFEIYFTDSANMKDSAGEAYYHLDGTDKKWHVTTVWDESKGYPPLRARIDYENLGTKDVAQGTVHDLGWPTSFEGVTLQWVLTGSETYGYWSSVQPPVAWMHSILDVIGERKLKYICMPGSHDAGVSKIDGHTGAATKHNTQTQFLDIYGQLFRGSRWFDMRPCLGNGGKQHLCHYGDVVGVTQGANGILIDDAIDQVNKFMDENPGELVILDVNDESGYNTDAGGPKYPRLTKDEWKPLWSKFRDNIKKPCKGFGGRKLYDVTINEFISDGKGCVITLHRNLAGAEDDAERGFYDWTAINQYNSYANTDRYQSMAEDQILKMKQQRKLFGEDKPESNDQFFILSWTMTLQAGDIITPLANRAGSAMSSLFWYAYREFTPTSYPNVIYLDFLGQPFTMDYDLSQEKYRQLTTGDVAALAMAVNLQIASQNCVVGGGSII